MDRSFKCCICGNTFTGWGNNPYPVNDEANTKCCNECNMTHVIPARLQIIFNRDEKEKQNG